MASEHTANTRPTKPPTSTRITASDLCELKTFNSHYVFTFSQLSYRFSGVPVKNDLPFKILNISKYVRNTHDLIPVNDPSVHIAFIQSSTKNISTTASPSSDKMPDS